MSGPTISPTSDERIRWREHAWAAWLLGAVTEAVFVLASAAAHPWWAAVFLAVAIAMAFIAGAEIAFKWNEARTERLAKLASGRPHGTLEVIRITALRGQQTVIDNFADAAVKWWADESRPPGEPS